MMNSSTAKLASVLLQYPTAALFEDIAAVDAFVAGTGPERSRESFARFLRWLRATDPAEVARHYVETFDLRRRCSLYLTYYRYGDTRKRGMAMVIIKAAYRDAGYLPTGDELPDYLPMVLDFAALCPRGVRLLTGYRPDLQLLYQGLLRAASPYSDVVAALTAALPKLGKHEWKQVHSAWEMGPPREEVGLQPFAPPGYLSGYGVTSGDGKGRS